MNPAAPQLNAGELDRRVVLLRPKLNDWGDEIEGWEEVATVWASVRPGAGRETSEAGRLVALTTVDVRIRYRADVDARWRIRDRDKEYEVRALADVARLHVQLQMVCDEVQ